MLILILQMLMLIQFGDLRRRPPAAVELTKSSMRKDYKCLHYFSGEKIQMYISLKPSDAYMRQ